MEIARENKVEVRIVKIMVLEGFMPTLWRVFIESPRTGRWMRTRYYYNVAEAMRKGELIKDEKIATKSHAYVIDLIRGEMEIEELNELYMKKIGGKRERITKEAIGEDEIRKLIRNNI